MTSIDINLLLELADEYEKVSEKLTSQWVMSERVSKVLKRHHVRNTFFKQHFGTKMYGLFIDVTREQKKLDNCPFMHIFLHFCADKDINLTEVHVICSELKNVVVEYYIENFYAKDGKEMYWQLVDIFDTRFAGVMEEYLSTYCNFCHLDIDEVVSKSKAVESTQKNEHLIPCNHTQPVALLKDDRLKDIRFSNKERYSSEQLFEMLGDNVVDKIEEFTENLDLVLLNLYDIEEANAEESFTLMKKVTLAMEDFYALMGTLVVFPVVESTFKNLAQFLSNISIEEYQKQEEKDNLVTHLINLVKDLEKWIVIVFVEQGTQDVHYFDASFASNVAEIESIFTKQTIMNENEYDIEFF